MGESWIGLILLVANGLTGGDGAPGFVSLVLLAALLIFVLVRGWAALGFRRTVRDIRNLLPVEPAIEAAQLIEVDGKLAQARDSARRRSSPNARLVEAWFSFRETVLIGDDTSEPLRYTVRPNTYFMLGKLGLEDGIWRQIPALFVSVGLLLTFLGLVAALESTGQVLDAGGNAASADGLKRLLQVASAKFIMSLTGLACSILFTLWLRGCAGWMQSELDRLCRKIEQGGKFVNEQDLLLELSREAREQTAQLQTFSTELVAQIAKPLREDLPNAIREAVEPAMRQVSQSAGQGLGDLASTVSGQLEEGMKASVEAMNGAVGAVSEQMQAIATHLDRSAGQMSGQVEQAVEALAGQIETLSHAMRTSSEDAAKTFNDGAGRLLQRMDDSLAAMRVNASESAAGLRRGSEAMAETALALSESIQRSVADAAESSSREIASAGQTLGHGISEATETMRQDLVEPMTGLVEKVGRLAAQMEAVGNQILAYSRATESGTDAMRSANGELGRAAATLSAAADPVERTVSQIESATRDMGDRVRAASGALETVMHAARAAIQASEGNMRELAGVVQATVREFRQIVEGYDGELGHAFEQIQGAIQSSLEQMNEFNQRLNKELAEALNRLEAVVAQAEPFEPR